MSVNGVSSSNAASANQTNSNSNPYNSLDENAFLKILTAELANQDPSNSSDSTEYISQLAQFSSLEQMSNLNTTMKFTGMAGLIGKTVSLSETDSSGNNYVGTVKSVYKSGDAVSLDVVVGKTKDSSGNTVDDVKTFNADDVTGVENTTQSS